LSKLEAALAWARRGFPVFPLEPNGKKPLDQTSWPEQATTDEVRVRALWTLPVLGTEADYNIGMLCTDRIVIDIDVKQGKDGYNEFRQLTANSDLPWNTLVVRTPSGGLHLYYEGPDSGNAPITPAVDVRSHNGYVVVPGSTIDGVAYRVERDVVPAWIPFVLEERLTAYAARSERLATGELDTEAAIQAGINFLQSTPPAIEGQRGDETTFIVAARLVRELALSPEKALELMMGYYNERCIPPWSLDELQRKVRNAYEYGTADAGRLDAASLFGGLEIKPPPSIFAFATAGLTWGNAVDPMATKPRPWLLDKLLMLGNTTAILAPGGVGKSTLALIIAAHLAMGLDFGPHHTYMACRSVIYNGEDDLEEQSRRLQAVCTAYNFDYNAVRERIMFLGDKDGDMRIVVKNGNVATVNQAVVSGLIDLLKDPTIGLFGGDPLIDMHGVNENDPNEMNLVMRVLKQLATAANVAVVIVHHTVKAGSERQENRVGNMDIGRGSSAIVYKARASFTLLDASADDCEQYGIQDGDRHTWVRLDDAKGNSFLRSDKPLWFRREGTRILNGEVVGVLKFTELVKSTTYMKLRVAGILIDNLLSMGAATMTMAQATAIVKAGEPVYSNKTEAEIRSRIEGMFNTPTEVRGRRLEVRRDPSGKALVILS
jgi:bifunctional DNA primase/polymerase-like protein/AAA domain-containing protein